MRKSLYILVFFYCFWQRVFTLFTIFYDVVLGIIYTDAVTFGSAGCTRKTLSDIVNENNGGTENNTNGGTENNTTTGTDDSYHEYEVGDTVQTMFFDFSVLDYLSTTDINGITPEAGKQFVGVKLNIENTFNKDITMFSSDIIIEWDKLNADDPGAAGPNSYYDKEAIFNEEFEKEYTLAPGESKEGVLVFEIPEGITKVAITTQDIYVDKQGNEHKGDVYIVNIDLSKQ